MSLRWFTEFLDHQTPAVRAVLIAFAGAVVAGLLRFLGDYLGSLALSITSTVAAALFIFRGLYAIHFLSNRRHDEDR